MDSFRYAQKPALAKPWLMLRSVNAITPHMRFEVAWVPEPPHRRKYCKDLVLITGRAIIHESEAVGGIWNLLLHKCA